MAEHAVPSISVFVIPDGFGDKLFSVACDNALQMIRIQEPILRRRARLFHAHLIAAIRAADGHDNIDRWGFDVASVTAGNLTGLRAIAIGSTRQKRLRACKIALALAAVHYTRWQMRVAFLGSIPPIVFPTILSFLIGNSTLKELVATSQIISLDHPH